MIKNWYRKTVIAFLNLIAKFLLFFSCNIENTEMEEPHSEETNKLCLSGASTAYYSPNESFKTNANSDFLEKLSQVINIPSPDLSEYASILEDTENSQHQTKDTKSQNELLNIPHNFVADQGERNYNDTCTNFIKASAVRDTHYDIENFQQTLVENTYIVSEEEEEQINEEHSMDENSFCGEKEFVNDEEEQVIIISDESSSSVGDSEGDDLNYDKKSITFEREVSSDSHTNKTIKSEKIECKCEIYKDNLEENIQEQSNEDKIKSHQGIAFL